MFSLFACFDIDEKGNQAIVSDCTDLKDVELILQNEFYLSLQRTWSHCACSLVPHALSHGNYFIDCCNLRCTVGSTAFFTHFQKICSNSLILEPTRLNKSSLWLSHISSTKRRIFLIFSAKPTSGSLNSNSRRGQCTDRNWVCLGFLQNDKGISGSGQIIQGLYAVWDEYFILFSRR